MSAIGDCSRPCPVPAPVNIPGTPGASPITNTTSNLVLPAVGANVEIFVLSTAGFVAGQNIIIAGPANFKVVSVDTPTSLTGEFLGLTGDLAPAAIISYGAEVTFAGQPGQAGVAGENGYTLTTSAFQVPSVGQNVSLAVLNSACFVKGQNVIVGGVSNAYGSGTGSANFIVASINGPTSVTLTFLGYPNDVPAGTTFNSGATVASAGSAGQNAFTTTTAPFTIPAIGSTVSVNVASTAWIAIGQILVVDGPATFSVYSITDGTHVVLTFLGYVGNLPVGTVIASSSKVSPSGTQAIGGSDSEIYEKGDPASHSDGSNFPLPTTFAAVVISSTTIQITLPVAGKWLLFTNAVFGLSGADGSNTAVVSMKLRCTTNTVTDIVNSRIDFQVGLGAPGAISNDNIGGVDGFKYQGQAGDVLQMQAQSTITPSSGVFCLTSASIAAIQIG